MPSREAEAVGSHEGAGPGSCAPDASSSPAGSLRPARVLSSPRRGGESPGYQSGLHARTGAGVLGRGCWGSWARRPRLPRPFCLRRSSWPPFSFLPRLRKTFIRSPRSKSAPSHPLAASRSRGGPPPAVLPSQSPSPRGSESPWVAGCWGECRGGGAAGGGRLRRDGLPAGLRGRAAGPAHRKLLPLPARAPASCQPPPRPERGRDRGAGTARRPEGVALRGPARAACWRM